MSKAVSDERKRIALDDTAVVVPIRIDSPDRIRNLDIILTWLDRCFEGQRVFVLEHGPVALAGEVVRKHGAEHVFLHSHGSFHKSRVFNLGIALAERPFVLLYDSDVLVPARAIDEAIVLLRRDEADYVYPYNGVMLDIRCDDSQPRAILDADFLVAGAACTGASLADLPNGASYLNGTLDEPSTGGVLACRRRTLLLQGGFNPNIVSYGCEDTELETRVAKLGGRVARLPRYNCFHIRHRRGPDSRYNDLHNANLAEWRKVEAMSSAALADYVQNGFRSIVLSGNSRVEVVDTPERFSVSVLPPTEKAILDTAFVVLMPTEPALPAALVTSLIDRIEASYSGYEIHLLERDAYRYRTVSHRDHVVYASVSGESDRALLERLAGELERTRLCVCSVFLDARPETLGVSLASLGAGAVGTCELALSDAPPDADPRQARLSGMLRSRLGGRARSFAFDRATLLECLGSRSAEWRDRSSDEILDAAHAELRGRLK